MDLDRTFTYHAPTPEQITRYAAIRDQAKGLARLLATLCPESREKSLALTAVQQAVMWANAAIAIHDQNAQSSMAHVVGCLCPTCGDQMRLKPGWNG